MKRKIIFTICLILACAFSSGFMLSGKKWKEAFPLVDYKINPEGFGVSTDSAMKKILKASSLWSFQESETHFHFSYKGQTGVTEMQSVVASGINCSDEGKKAAKALTNTIYSKASFDPECTGPACSYVWSCGDEIIHFDIQINSGIQPLNFSETPNSSALDALAVISEQFGYALGLDNCSPGDTSAQCLAKSPNGQSDPPVSSAMSKLKFPGTLFTTLSNDDKSGIRSIYGNFTEEEVNMYALSKGFSSKVATFCSPSPCRLPEEENDPRYILQQDERESINFANNQLAVEGKSTREFRLEKFKWYQDSYTEAFQKNKITAEAYMIHSIDNAGYFISNSPNELIRESRKLLVVQIQSRAKALEEFKYDLDFTYLNFEPVPKPACT